MDKTERTQQILNPPNNPRLQPLLALSFLLHNLNANNPLLVSIPPERVRVLLSLPFLLLIAFRRGRRNEDPPPPELLHVDIRALQVGVLAQEEGAQVEGEELWGEDEWGGFG